MLSDREDPLGIHQKLVEPANQFIVSAEDAIHMFQDEVQGPEGRVNRILNNLVQTTDEFQDRLDAVQSDLQDLLQTATGMLTENRANIADIVRRLRRVMWEAEMTLRKIRANPALLFLGDDEKMLEATMVDESGLRRTGRARPYEQRDESDDGS